MRAGAIVLSSLLLAVLILATFPAGADGGSWGTEDVLVHLRVRFETLRSGELSLFVGNASQGSMVFEEGPAPMIYQASDSNLVRLHSDLLSTNWTWVSLFRSVLDPGEGVEVSGPILRYSDDGLRFGALFTARFNVTGNDGTPEYRLLTFVRGIRPREIDPNDPYSAIDRDRDIDRLSKITIRVQIEPPENVNMDLQFDGTDHRRGFPRESFDRSITLIEYNERGNYMVLTGSSLFSPLTVLLFCIITVLTALVLIAFAWVRKRFRRWALAFPLMAILPCLFTVWTYIRPYINIYGTFEGGVMASALVMLSTALALQFAPDGMKKGMDLGSVENDADEGNVDLEMPKVVYVDRHVFVNTGTNRKRAGGGGVEDEDPYKVLGIGRDADDGAIEKAFREKIHIYHPDKFANNPEWVREKAKEETVRLNRAYEALKKDKL